MPSALDLLGVGSSKKSGEGVKSALDLLKPKEKKLESVAEPVAEPKLGIEQETVSPPSTSPERTEEFYSSYGFGPPFQGSIPFVTTPALSAKFGQLGYGPKPAGGWSEAGVPLNEEGKPYVTAVGEPEKDFVRDTIAETLKGISTLATHPYEVVRGVVDFALSMPGFITGIFNGASRISKGIISQLSTADPEEFVSPIHPLGIDVSKIFDLNELYNLASQGMAESMAYFEPAKEMLGAHPTPESELAVSVAMAPISVLSALGHSVANYEGFKNNPNIQGAARFLGDVAGLAVMGAVLHGPSRKAEFAKSVEQVVGEAAEIIKREQGIEGIPNEIVKQAKKKVLEMEKAQLDLRAKEIAKMFTEDVLIREELGRQAEQLAKEKAMPVAPSGVKGLTAAQKRAVREKVEPSEIQPEYEFTSKKGNYYFKVGDKWFDDKGFPVTNTFKIKAAEKGKNEIKLEEPKAEPKIVGKKKTKAKAKVKVEEPKVEEPKSEYSPYKGEVRKEAHELFDALELDPKYKRMRSFRVKEKVVEPGEQIEIPNTWHDAVYRFTATRDAEGNIIAGRSGSYDSILNEGHVAAKKKGTIPPGATLYVLDVGGEGSVAQTRMLRIYRAKRKTEKVEPKKLPAPDVKKLPDAKGKVLKKKKGSEEVTVVEPKTKPTDIDLVEGGESNPLLEGDLAPFFQDKETTNTYKNLFSGRKIEDVEVYTQKLVNDVNRWYHGEKVDITKVRDQLSRLAAEAGEFRQDFMTGADHLAWNETVSEAAKWARGLDRLENKRTGGPQLNAMIPVDQLPKTVQDFILKSKKGIEDLLGYFNKDEVALRKLYRHKGLWQQTGFWLGKDWKWRYELRTDNISLSNEASQALQRGEYVTTYLSNIVKEPKLYDAIPELRSVRVEIGPGYSAYYDHASRTIRMPNSKYSLIHEMQHAINSAVNAFRGTNPSVEGNKLVDKAFVEMMQVAKSPEIRKELEDLAREFDNKPTFDSAELAERVYEVDPDLVSMFENLVNSEEALKNYMKSPGEMEARLAEKRMAMPRALWEREAPWETLDRMLQEEAPTLGLDRFDKYTEAGTKLYSGIPIEESIVKAAKSTADYVRKAREMKKLKPREAAKRGKEEFVRTWIDRSGNIRKGLLRDIKGGYKIVQEMYLSKGAPARAANMLKQMRKEVYHGLNSNEKRILDTLILASRIIDIGKYKSKKAFNYPEGLTPENCVAYMELFPYIEKLSPKMAEEMIKRTSDYFEWMKKPLKDMLDAQLISENEYNDLVSHNYRRIKLVDVYDKRYGSKLGGRKRNVYDSGIEALAKGRETDIFEPSSEVMALEVFNRAYGRILNNKANLNLLDLARRDNTNPYVRVKGEKGEKIPSGWNRVFVHEEGKRQSIFLSPEMSKEWIVSSPEVSYKFSQFLRYASGSPVLRTFATGINWGFALANLPRDVMHVWFTAREFKDGKWKPIYNPNAPIYAAQIGRDLASVLPDILLRKGRYQDYLDDGGGMEFLVHQGRLFQRGRHVEKPLDRFYDFAGFFGETSEAMVRVGIRERVIRRRAKERGISVEEARKIEEIRKEASFAARDYMDFGQGGSYAKVLDNGVPYLNAAIQGTRGMFRAFKDNKLSATYKMAQFASAVVGLYVAMRAMAPKTAENLRGNIDMQNNLCVPLGDDFAFEDEYGQKRYLYFKLPLDPSQKFFKTFFEACTDKWLGYEVDVNRVVDSLKEQSPVDVTELPPSVSGILGYVNNKDFWLNEEIWKKSEAYGYQLPKAITEKSVGGSEEEYDKNTPEFYKDFGAATGMSPERTRYMIEELLTNGTIWSYLLGQGYNAMFEDVPKEKKQQHLAMTLARMPVVKRFFGVTNPYSKHAAKIDKAEEIDLIERNVQNRELDLLTDGYLYQGTVEKKEISNYIKGFKDQDVRDRLFDRYTFQKNTKGLPNRSFWLRLRGLNVGPRAEVFAKEFFNASDEKKEQMRREMSVVAEAGGVLTESFWLEVSKVRREMRAGD